MTLSRKKIEVEMARKALTITGLATKYGVSRARMNIILNSQNVTTACAGRLADALDVDVTTILSEE